MPRQVTHHQQQHEQSYVQHGMGVGSGVGWGGQTASMDVIGRVDYDAVTDMTNDDHNDMFNNDDNEDMIVDGSSSNNNANNDNTDAQADNENAPPIVPVVVEDPLSAALDDLEGRVVASLDEFRQHPGVRTGLHNNSSGDDRSNTVTLSIHEELNITLRPALEVAAHSGPSVARSRGPSCRSSVDAAVDEVHRRINGDLVLPVLLETAQSDPSAPKRAAALTFFHRLYNECRTSGSYLYVDPTAAEKKKLQKYHHHHHDKDSNKTISDGPYGSPPQTRQIAVRRLSDRSKRSAELIRYWVEAAAACATPGAFTDPGKDGAVASRAVLAATAAVRPAMFHVAGKVASADDAGALRLYIPSMRMVGCVLRRLFVPSLSSELMMGGSSGGSGGGGGDGRKRKRGKDISGGRSTKDILTSEDNARAACIKFLEAVVLCFSRRAQPGSKNSGLERSRNNAVDGIGGGGGGDSYHNLASSRDNDFALEDLPVGHPVITRKALEEIGEDAFTILRGLLQVGGQRTIDPGVTRDVMNGLGLDKDGYGSGATPSAQIVAILRPAALSFLEVESASLQKATKKDKESDKAKDEDKDTDNEMESEGDDCTTAKGNTSRLEISQAEMLTNGNADYFPRLDRSDLETDFDLSHKSYALTVSAVSMLATNRPVFFKDSATCLARRTVDPPPIPPTSKSSSISTSTTSSVLSRAAAMAVRSHLRAACLTLLRNHLSVTLGGSEVLHRALSSNLCDMARQADKALKMAGQAAALRTAGRATRNRAAMFYQWDTGEGGIVGTKGSRGGAIDGGGGDGTYDPSDRRKRAGDDKLENMRRAKAARGLGNGIQLPISMSDSVELVLANLRHLPVSKMTATAASEKKIIRGGKRKADLDFLIDAVMTNGESLSSDECRFYSRDGGTAWFLDIAALVSDDDNEDNDGGAEKDGDGNEMMVVSTKRKLRCRFPNVQFSLDTRTLLAAGEAGRSKIEVNKKRGSDDKDVIDMIGANKKDDKNKVDEKSKKDDGLEVYMKQCRSAAADSFKRIVARSRSARSSKVADFGNKIAARLAWTLRGVQPSSELKGAMDLALEGASSNTNSIGGNENAKIKVKDEKEKTEKDGEKVSPGQTEPLEKFAKEFPLICSCLALDMVPGNRSIGTLISSDNMDSVVGLSANAPSSLTKRILNEAYLESLTLAGEGEGNEIYNKIDATAASTRYSTTLDIYVSSILRVCSRANEKPNDSQQKRVANLAASALPQHLAVFPCVTESALNLTSSMCDIEAVTKKASEASRKASNLNIASSAAAHAAKAAAEKRAIGALLALRDVAFQRSKTSVRRSAVSCAVGIAAGRLSASSSVEEKALKLVMNVIFKKAPDLAEAVIDSAKEELERAALFAEENYKEINEANTLHLKKHPHRAKNPMQPHSDKEKAALARVRKPVVLFMALCVRKPEIIKTLMSISYRSKVDVLIKAIKLNMPMLARAIATKYGVVKIALQVADLADDRETPMLLSFLHNLTPADKDLPSQELIDACHEIQIKKLGNESKKDARLIIPVVSGMKRDILKDRLSDFVASSDDVFKAALNRMRERVGRYALHFRDEPVKDATSLNGMTLCEQMVYLHRMDFAAVGLSQKRYVDAIRLCLEDSDVFTDRIIMAALDFISGKFLAGDENLPLAYMRTIILTVSKYDSLHPWICHVLLVRLIEGKIYNDRRQWEGWMRCAKMLENTVDSGVSSIDAIQKLPKKQHDMYRTKYPQKTKKKA